MLLSVAVVVVVSLLSSVLDGVTAVVLMSVTVVVVVSLLSSVLDGTAVVLLSVL